MTFSKKELFTLLESRDLKGLPILVLANKIDLDDKMTEIEIVKGMNLDYIVENPWSIIPISAKNGTNMDQVVEWLLKTAEDFQ